MLLAVGALVSANMASLERHDFSSNRHLAYFYLNRISAQTRPSREKTGVHFVSIMP